MANPLSRITRPLVNAAAAPIRTTRANPELAKMIGLGVVSVAAAGGGLTLLTNSGVLDDVSCDPTTEWQQGKGGQLQPTFGVDCYSNE